MSELVNVIKDYYEKRNLTWPNFDNAIKFLVTELAEVEELDLDRSSSWVRNHPETKPKYNKEDMAEELGDVVLMAMVAGIVDGVDPLEALLNKMNNKLKALGFTSEPE